MTDQSSFLYQQGDKHERLKKTAWYFEGRLAFASDKESMSGNINWRHGVGRDDIEIVGPLAQGRVLISVVPNGVSIDDGESVQTFSGSANDILQLQLGMDVPVDALKYWVLGESDPAHSFIAQDEGFFQQGWVVRIKEMQQVKDWRLPKRLLLENDKTRIKIIVDRWDLS